MAEWIDSILTDTEINAWTVISRMTLSLVLGLVIGAEREMRRRDAGMRTFTLIVMGSAIAMILSIWIPQIYPNFLNGDPGRIAAQVITGIGFLGAGAIVRGQGSIQGLTTAASIWTAAVIGMAVGAGLYNGAILATAFTIFVLVGVEHLEKRLVLTGVNRILILGCSTTEPDIEQIKAVIEENKITASSYTFSIDYENNQSTLTIKVSIKGQVDQLKVSKAIHDKIPYVKSVNMVA
ncbi:MAG: MgtC/SapB family protein [Bacteroidales bacterium]|nr:MgtC/SapB family protein [Bacteroidales bacterium]